MLSVAVGLAVSVFFATPADEPSLSKELAGVWRLNSTSAKGAAPLKPDGPAWLVIFDNGEFVTKGTKGMWGGTVSVDTQASPATMDFLITLRTGSGPERFTNLGVYELKEGVLTVARAPDGKGRPASVAKGPDVVLQVYGKVR